MTGQPSTLVSAAHDQGNPIREADLGRLELLGITKIQAGSPGPEQVQPASFCPFSALVLVALSQRTGVMYGSLERAYTLLEP